MIDTKNYAGILQQVNALLNHSLSEIKNRCVDCSCSVDVYFEKNEIAGKTIEIRFDKEELTMTGVLNIEDKCRRIYLFPDNAEMLDGFATYLNKFFGYECTENAWITSTFYVKAENATKLPGDLCFVFYS